MAQEYPIQFGKYLLLQRIAVGGMAEVFKALSNPSRLKIFIYLKSLCGTGEPCCSDDDLKSCVGEIGKNLDVAPSTVSHHMKELRHAGLILMERCGKTVDCCIEQEMCRVLSGFFADPVAGRGDD